MSMPGPAMTDQWVRITCEERDTIMVERDLVPISSCTDLGAEFHSQPEVFTEWGDRATEQPVLRDYRFPAPQPADWREPAGPDLKPCEHYRFEENNDV